MRTAGWKITFFFSFMYIIFLIGEIVPCENIVHNNNNNNNNNNKLSLRLCDKENAILYTLHQILSTSSISSNFFPLRGKWMIRFCYVRQFPPGYGCSTSRDCALDK